MITDTHHHLWVYNKVDYGWMDQRMEALRRDHLPDELYASMQNSGVRQTIVVQARQSLVETKWLLGMSDLYPWITGVVGWVDLRSDELLTQLDYFAKHPTFKGVRHVIHDEPDDQFMARADFRRGIAALQAYDLTYDLLIFPKHLKLAAELCAEFPEQRFIIDHLAKPLVKEAILDPWYTDLKAFRSLKNVACKLSGMVTEAHWGSWRKEQFIPYLNAAIEIFGTDRLMVGSDWPVCRLAGNYSEVMEIVP